MKAAWLCFFITQFAFGQYNADSLIIKNKVKEVRIISPENHVASISKYDPQGRLTYRAFEDFDGYRNLKSSIEWIYDSSGKKIKTVITHSSYNYPIIWFYEYDERGNKIATRENGKPVFQYFYDDTNFLIKELAFAADTIRRVSVYEKADNGLRVIEKMKTRINTTYFDHNGNVIKSESLDGNKVNSSFTYLYEGNRLIKTIEHSGGGKNYLYDQKGQLVKVVHFQTADGIETETGTEEFIYDIKGLITRYTDEELEPYRYEYDFY